eukprot:3682434-Rhodomonas_salina.3
MSKGLGLLPSRTTSNPHEGPLLLLTPLRASFVSVRDIQAWTGARQHSKVEGPVTEDDLGCSASISGLVLHARASAPTL